MNFSSVFVSTSPPNDTVEAPSTLSWLSDIPGISNTRSTVYLAATSGNFERSDSSSQGRSTIQSGCSTETRSAMSRLPGGSCFMAWTEVFDVRPG